MTIRIKSNPLTPPLYIVDLSEKRNQWMPLEILEHCYLTLPVYLSKVCIEDRKNIKIHPHLERAKKLFDLDSIPNDDPYIKFLSASDQNNRVGRIICERLQDYKLRVYNTEISQIINTLRFCALSGNDKKRGFCSIPEFPPGFAKGNILASYRSLAREFPFRERPVEWGNAPVPDWWLTEDFDDSDDNETIYKSLKEW